MRIAPFLPLLAATGAAAGRGRPVRHAPTCAPSASAVGVAIGDSSPPLMSIMSTPYPADTLPLRWPAVEEARGQTSANLGQLPLPQAAPDAGATGIAAGEPPTIPAGTAVLHFGDSFVLAGFAQALRPRLKRLGVRYAVRSEQSSYTVTWAQRVEQIVADTQPDLVIITLGANEVANTDPRAHAPAVRRIVRLIGHRPCVWVSPPLWRRDTGIVDVIRQNSAPCRFFDSDKLVTEPISRRNDKIHPDERGGEIWADAFFRWLLRERAPAVHGRSAWALRPSPTDEHRASASDSADPSTAGVSGALSASARPTP